MLRLNAQNVQLKTYVASTWKLNVQVRVAEICTLTRSDGQHGNEWVNQFDVRKFHRLGHLSWAGCFKLFAGMTNRFVDLLGT